MNEDEKEAIRNDPLRLKLKDLLRRKGLTLAAASTALGRNKAYLQQYVERGSPAVLGYRDGEALGELLDCDPGELRHETLPERRPHRRKHPTRPIANVSEVTVEAAAGAGAFEPGFVTETARWGWPANMIRHEGGAAPENLRIIRVRGDSMTPEMNEGDRVVVDVSRKIPATGETFVLWDGNGIVVKKVDTAPPGEVGGPPRIRLISENPDYPPYTCLADDVHVLGKALWVVRRV